MTTRRVTNARRDGRREAPRTAITDGVLPRHLRSGVGLERVKDDLVTHAADDRDESLARGGHVATGTVADREATTGQQPDPDIRVGTLVRDDARHDAAVRRPDERQPELAATAQVGSVDDIDNGKDVPLAAFAEERDGDGEQTEREHRAKDPDDRQEEAVAIEQAGAGDDGSG